MRENEDLDLLLDSAVKTYAESETSPNLEQRILARIAAEPPTAQRSPWLPWATALPAAACLLLFVLIMSQQHREPNQITHAPNKPAIHVGSVAPAATPVRSAKTRASSSRSSLRADSNVLLPKLDVFPAPQPLTREEQALVAYAARAPKPQLQALIAVQQRPEAPLNITAIQIPPLEDPNDGNK